MRWHVFAAPYQRQRVLPLSSFRGFLPSRPSAVFSFFVLARLLPLSSLRGTKCRSNLSLFPSRSFPGHSALFSSRRLRAFPSSLRGFSFFHHRQAFPPFVIARFFLFSSLRVLSFLSSLRGSSPSRHCEARSAEAISPPQSPPHDSSGRLRPAPVGERAGERGIFE